MVFQPDARLEEEPKSRLGLPLEHPLCISTRARYAPALGTFGNLGRNTLVGPGITDVDFAVSKHVRVTEGKEVLFGRSFSTL